MQRRASGRYEFRKRLPKELAGQPVPAHVRAAFPELINPQTGCFKGEIVRSLDTTDYGEAKRRDLREARKALDMFAAAEMVVNGQPKVQRRAPGGSDGPQGVAPRVAAQSACQ